MREPVEAVGQRALDGGSAPHSRGIPMLPDDLVLSLEVQLLVKARCQPPEEHLAALAGLFEEAGQLGLHLLHRGDLEILAQRLLLGADGVQGRRQCLVIEQGVDHLRPVRKRVQWLLEDVRRLHRRM